MFKKSFSKDTRAVIAIEAAILLPVFIILIFMLIELGFYFIKSQAAGRAVSTTANSIQANPASPDLEIVAKQSGLSILDLDNLPNFVCAKSYLRYEGAKNGLCSAGEWQTIAPRITDDSDSEINSTYYVAVMAYSEQKSLTGVLDTVLPDIRERTVVQISTVPESPIIAMKSKTYMPAAGQKLDKTWKEGSYLNISYTPKSDNSKIKVSFTYHLKARRHTDEGYFLVWNTVLRLNGSNVPNMFKDKVDQAASTEHTDTYYINSWGTNAATLSLAFRTDDNVNNAATLHQFFAYSYYSAANKFMPGSIEIVEFTEE